MTLAETLRRGRMARARVPVRDAAEDAPTKPVAGTQPEPGATASEPTLRDWIGVLAMVTGLFMAIMDVQIVTSSLTQIQGGLSASTDEISWVQTSYLIADVVMVPLSGTLSRLLSTRVLFVTAALGFTAASALCATATNLGQMIVYRAFQGFSGGAMMPLVFLGGLQYALQEGPRWDWLADNTIVAAVLMSSIASVLFFWRVLTYRQPIVDVRAFLNRNFALGSFYTFVVGTGMYGTTYLVPLF